MLKKALSLLQFLPILVFMYSFVLFMSWEAAFEFSGIVAAVVVIALFFAKVKMDNFMLGASLFFALGAAMFFFNIGSLEYVYGYYMEAMLFASVLIVGLVTTFSATTGFIGVSHDAHVVRRSSLYLLLGVVVALIIAFFMRGDALNGFVIPWFLLLSLRYLLR